MSGRRAFAVAGPSAWNSVPDPVMWTTNYRQAITRTLHRDGQSKAASPSG